ncbi:hypothetical protein SSAmo_0640 [Enterobacterales bacterium endosymbiont of Anomoneura mori]|uniref:3'-5' exonuclease n=1 Tax=Enterobacterales bacterium endosymbiont of Anomoneura mori TaxID=3132096 RepID=UPI00399D5566
MGIFLLYKDNNKKIKNLNKFIKLSKSYYLKNKFKKNILNSFLLYFEMIYEKNSKNENSVKLMTLHSSKGLEFNQVFIIGMEEGILPSKYSKRLKIFRRRNKTYLCWYNKGKKNFYILSVQKERVLYGKKNFPIQSRFIDEITFKYIKIVNK